MELEVHVKPTENEGEWELLEAFSLFGTTVPKGFRTDGASIPWGVQWLVKKGGRVFAPAVLHDFYYRTGIIDRKTADCRFLEAMTINEVPKWKRTVMFRAVRICGGLFYVKS